MFGAAIYQAKGDPGSVVRLTKMYDLLQAWDAKQSVAGPDWTVQLSFADEMRDWAEAGFNKESMPKFLVMLLAMGFDGKRDDGSLGRAREWLRSLVLGSEDKHK